MNSSEHDFDCDRAVDSGAYVLGALEESDADGYREHLQSCAICRQEVQQLQSVVGELPIGVPALSAPTELRQRIMSTVNAEAELLAAAGSQADEPISRRERWRVRPVFGGLLASGAVALGVLLGALVITGGSDNHTRITPATVASNAPGARAELRQSGSRSELDVSDMPAPPLGRIYEVWLQRGNQAPQPTDALFSVTNRGNGSVDVPGDLRGVSKVMVTDEPLGGSLRPTRSPIIVVTLI